MKIIQMAVGPIQANCYIVYKEGSSKAFVIDPGEECSKIMEKLKECGIDEVTHILLTHGHFDHVGAAEEMKRKTGAKVCIHEGDLDMLENPENSFNVMMGVHFRPCEADTTLKGGETIDAAGMDVYTLHTPGHSPGSVCYITEDVMFSGDTLFYMSIGRTDFPGASSAEIYDSLKKLGSLKRDYTVYTGHGPKTTLAFEMHNNPYITREE
jgi:hydroxyacylglutathione hydrolase